MPGSILLILAHPDDESSLVSGTAAKYARFGISVDLICATGGEKGTRLDVPSDVDTALARVAELRVAANLIGIRNIYLLGYVDGDLDKVDTSEITDKILDIMHNVCPEIVITFGPDGISGHPDHIAISRVTTAAFEEFTKSDGGPHKLYYITIPSSMLAEIGSESVKSLATRPDNEITTTIDISGYFNIKIQALEAHKSQQDARLVAEILQSVKEGGWKPREYFFLVSSNSTEKETDLYD
ncbi:MAG: PIG-L family deacetylase [Dehalococcoidales bacterium]|nr:MAG: PIG-L family deacetylase [Dehalococcoidales bacterium]